MMRQTDETVCRGLAEIAYGNDVRSGISGNLISALRLWLPAATLIWGGIFYGIVRLLH
jgi:hypothetical protein